MTPASPAIFIVEDEAIVTDDIRQTLEGLGYRVAGSAGSGEAALEMMRESRPDLVLMDIQLAGEMDGIETAEQVRGLHHIPVVFLTAFADKALLERARTTGPYGYLLKPFDERAIQSAIEIALYKHGMDLRLQESEATTRLMVDATQDLLFLLAADGRFLMANRAFAERAGSGTEDLKGSSAYDLVGKGILSPKMACWHLVTHGERSLNFEEQLNLGWYDVTIYPVYDAAGAPEKYAVSIRDITARKRIDEQMKNNAEYFRSMIEETAEVVVLLNADGTFSQPSPSFRDAIGRGKDENLTGNFFDHLSLSDWQQAKQAFSEIVIHPGMARAVQLKFERPDKSVCSIKGILSNLSDNPFIGKIVLYGWVE